ALVRTSSACAVASRNAMSSMHATVARPREATLGRRARPGADSGGDGLPARSGAGHGGAGAHGQRLGHGDVGAAGDTAPAVVELAATAAVLEDHRPLALQAVAVAPLQQGHQHRPQVGPLLREAVLVTRGPLLVGALHEDPLLDQALEARLEHVARHAQVALEIVEAPDAE